MRFKPSEALRFLGGLAAAAAVLGFVAIRVTSCAPAPHPQPTAPARAPQPGPSHAGCNTGPAGAAGANAQSLRTLAWTPFGRPEIGWATYAPLIAREIGTTCAPDSPGFAAALAGWEQGQKLPADGILDAAAFDRMRLEMHARRPIVAMISRKLCPDPPPPSLLEVNRPGEAYGGKTIELQPDAFAAWRRMVAAAKAEDPRIAADPRNLTIFSGFRDPEADARRCKAEGNCQGLVRAACSPHRTGLTVDMYVGQAPGFGPDSSDDSNRLYMSMTPTYRWLVANAGRFGFVPYPFEPWHWEWTGGQPWGRFTEWPPSPRPTASPSPTTTSSRPAAAGAPFS